MLRIRYTVSPVGIKINDSIDWAIIFVIKFEKFRSKIVILIPEYPAKVPRVNRREKPKKEIYSPWDI